MDTDVEMKREAANRKRHQQSKTVVFKKICKGVYISHEWNMTLSYEATWSRVVGRKWELTWKESYMGLMTATKCAQKFDTIADARKFANNLAAKSRS